MFPIFLLFKGNFISYKATYTDKSIVNPERFYYFNIFQVQNVGAGVYRGQINTLLQHFARHQESNSTLYITEVANTP